MYCLLSGVRWYSALSAVCCCFVCSVCFLVHQCLFSFCKRCVFVYQSLSLCCCFFVSASKVSTSSVVSEWMIEWMNLSASQCRQECVAKNQMCAFPVISIWPSSSPPLLNACNPLQKKVGTMTTSYQQQQQQTMASPNGGNSSTTLTTSSSSSSSTLEPLGTPRINCVVSIIADDDSDADTLKAADCGSGGHGYDDISYHYNPTPHPHHHQHHHHHPQQQHSYDALGSPSRSRPPMIKHIASSSSVCTMDTESRGAGAQVNGNTSSSSSGARQQSNGSAGQKTLGGRPYSGSTSGGSQTGTAPILLSVPSAAGPPRRRHSWICGWVSSSPAVFFLL